MSLRTALPVSKCFCNKSSIATSNYNLTRVDKNAQRAVQSVCNRMSQCEMVLILLLCYLIDAQNYGAFNWVTNALVPAMTVDLEKELESLLLNNWETKWQMYVHGIIWVPVTIFGPSWTNTGILWDALIYKALRTIHTRLTCELFTKMLCVMYQTINSVCMSEL